MFNGREKGKKGNASWIKLRQAIGRSVQAIEWFQPDLKFFELNMSCKLQVLSYLVIEHPGS